MFSSMRVSVTVNRPFFLVSAVRISAFWSVDSSVCSLVVRPSPLPYVSAASFAPSVGSATLAFQP